MRPLFIPFTKIDAVRREVYGIIAEERPDKKGEIFDYASSKPLVQEWSDWFKTQTGGKSLGNVRAMHGSTAAGKLTALDFDDEAKVIHACAKIEDDAEWEKVVASVYTGFSLGGDYVGAKRHEPEGVRYTARPHEVSLADNPCMYGATFTMVKTDGSTEVRPFRRPEDPAKEQTMAKAAGKKKVLKEGSTEAGKMMMDLKAFVAAHSLLDGDPATWDFPKMAAAISGVIGSDEAAEEPAAEEPAAPVAEAAAATAAAEGETAMTATVEPDATKTAGAGVTVVTKTDGTGAVPAKATDTGADKASASDVKIDGLAKAVALQAESLKTLTGEAFAKTIETIVTKAIGGVTEELRKAHESIADLKGKVDKIPAAVGRPIRKVIGGVEVDVTPEGQVTATGPEAMRKVVDALIGTGQVSRNSEIELRQGLAVLEIRKTQSGA